jgi:hypothetical protein
MVRRILLFSGVLPMLASGCALQEVRSKTAFGPEYRHSGQKNTNEERWTVQQGIELKWDKGITTGIQYRRRDVNDGTGDNENRVMLEFSFPLWKAEPKPSGLARRVRELERRLAAIESGGPGERASP